MLIPILSTDLTDFLERQWMLGSGSGRWPEDGDGNFQTTSIFWRWKHSIILSNGGAKTLRLFNTRFVHLVDSQVVLGVAAKGRTSSKRFEKKFA